jgi:DNA mismatch endonuclease (patch repair protein)
MIDILSVKDRSVRMSRIRSKDTKPELIVRKAIWNAGFRYRLHKRDLPGKPDLVFASIRTVVFVHGCYWHAHSCQKGRIPKQNGNFWRQKFDTNRLRDRRLAQRLRRQGWSVLTIWECSLSSAAKRGKAIDRLIDMLNRKRENAELCPTAKHRPRNETEATE